MILLCVARVLVELVPFRRWRGSLGSDAKQRESVEEGRRYASVVDHAAARLPFAVKCLPRAMALSWLLRRRQIAHALVLAARPAEDRRDADSLHAWVEIDAVKVIGDLPGPWLETLSLGIKSRR